MVSSDLPQLCLELSASSNLSLTLPYTIVFAIKHGDALSGKAVVFEWCPYTRGFREPGFMLLHHTATNLEAITVDRHSSLLEVSRYKPIVVNGWNSNLWELVPGGSVTVHQSLPETYQKLLEPGETYTLLWPGGEVATWEYGTVREHIGKELKGRSHPIVLPGGPHITFSTHTEYPPWPMRQEREARGGFAMANLAEQQWRFEQNRAKDAFPRTKHMEQDPDAPNLSVSLECPSSFRHDSFFEVTVKVTYEAQATTRPITFHTLIFKDYENYQLGRLCNGTWRNYADKSEGCGFRIVDDPDVSVIVGQHDHFASLQPGDSWMTSQRIGYNWTELPDDAENGETFRYVFRGDLLDWWDWGSKADHEETVVTLPCWISATVVDPKDNDGRPKLVVPTSNVVEFSFVE
jgi:hypothetical protein